MKVTVEFECPDELARAIAIRNGGRGLAQPAEIRSWAKEQLEIAGEMAVEEMRESLEEDEPS